METTLILILFVILLVMQGVGWYMQIDRVSAVVRLLEALMREDEPVGAPAPTGGARLAPAATTEAPPAPPSQPGRGRDLLRARLAARSR